jgi:hypothetical protein
MRLTRRLWRLDHYSVPAAGRKVKMSRSESYRAAQRGLIPTVEDNGFLWVPKELWDQRVKRLHRPPAHARSRRDTPAPEMQTPPRRKGGVFMFDTAGATAGARKWGRMRPEHNPGKPADQGSVGDHGRTRP